MMKWVCGVLGLAIAVAGLPIHGEDRLAGPVEADVTGVIDGDTLAVRAHIWLDQRVETRVRLAGVDTPELRGRCAEELALAALARDTVAARVAGRAVLLRNVRFGTYAGRVVAEVEVDGEDLSAMLIAAGLGQPYDGRGERPDWCG
ncbi:MAG: thermonuclease family protein [Rhodospirillaceae bacterium]|nr:thermonuclease family protein [Rhodospirillaceae bacterium]